MTEPPVLGEFNGHEIYPMPVFVKIGVADLAAAARWYEEALGFTPMFSMPGLVHLRRNKYQDILLVAAGSLELTFGVDDVDALAERARAAAPCGASSVSEPVETPWNSRDLAVTDPGGHRLVFTARATNPDSEQSRRWKTIFDEANRGQTPEFDDSAPGGSTNGFTAMRS